MALLAQPKTFSAARVSSFDRTGGNLDTLRVPATGEETTLADLKGPGAITHIWTTYRGLGRDLMLRIYWEGSDHPSVEAPMGDFFGVAMGIDAPINSYPIQVSSMGRARNCFWYMPFNKAARVTVTNLRGPKGGDIALYYYIDYQVFSVPIKDITYFHARFRETDPTERGKPVTLVEVEGEGHYVGVVMGYRARTPGWFGEGDDIITVDGTVSFRGTGTEDYFSDAWGFRVFSDLYHGVPVYEGRNVGDRLSAYRFHIADPIPFHRSFKFEIEHWPWASSLADTGREYYSAVGFWYQRTVHKAWPRVATLLSAEPWDPTKGRWHADRAIEAEDLGILEYHSKATVQMAKNFPGLSGPDPSTADLIRSRLFYGPKPAPQFLMPFLSGDYMLAFDSGGDGSFSVAVPVKEAGVYNVRIFYVRAEDYGIVRLRINGRDAGDPVDTFFKTDALTRPIWHPKEHMVKDVPLTEGLNVFEFSVNSKNPASDGYRLGIDYLVLDKQPREGS